MGGDEWAAAAAANTHRYRHSVQAADSLVVGDVNPDLSVGWDVKLGRPPSHTAEWAPRV